MQTPVYILCVILLATATKGEETWSYFGKHPRSFYMPPDAEPMAFGFPKHLPKYRPWNQWIDIDDARAIPRQYVQFNEELLEPPIAMDPPEKKANSRESSLSIVSNLAALRDHLILESAKKQLQQGAEENRKYLGNIGKRAGP